MKKIIYLAAFFIVFIIFSFNIVSAQRLSGTYTIGVGGNYTSITAAVNALRINGMSGNVTFTINSGNYSAESINFVSGIPFQGAYDTVTFTSLTNNPNNVTIVSSGGTSLYISDAKNIVIKNLTIGSAASSKGIEIDGACDNVEITNCKIYSDPIGNVNSNAGIYYRNTNNVSNNIRILNNMIDGGYYGIYFYGYGTNNYCTNFRVDNNTLSNAFLYGASFTYISLNSFSNNVITSRSANYSSSFYGVHVQYSNVNIIDRNRVQVLTTAISSPYGMYFLYLNYRNTTLSSLISNNEILVFTNNAYYGMYIYYSKADIYNNSILVGGNGVARALYIYMLPGLPINVKNNNLHATASSAYPIYINSASIQYIGGILKMDYNNYCNQTYIGYAGIDASNISDWQSITGQDAHSVSINPNYNDLFSFRLKTDGEGLVCPRIASVSNDMNDAVRQAITTMGAYHDYVPKTYDIKLLNLISPQKDISVGINTPVRISVMNVGEKVVDSINIHWEVNGTKQTYLWTGVPLSLGDSTPIITLGYFMPLAGENNVKIYTSLTGGKIDNNPLNDTIAMTAFGCKNTVNNIYTVGGSSADFATIKEAIDIISYCGVVSPTTISINPGIYYENLVIPKIKGTSTTNTLTITSANGDSSSVIIQSLSSAPPILLSNTNNIIIKKITIKGINTGNASIAIKFQNNNKNIFITNNDITVSTNNPSTTTSTDIMALHSYTSLDTNITISNNSINGSGGIYFYSQNTNAMTTNVNILNNTLNNIYYYGIYTYYTRIGLIKNNKIYQNAMAAIWGGGSGYGLYIYYSLGVINTITDISNNLIRGAFGNFSYLYYCQSNNGNNTNVLFTNNSLIKTGAGTVNYMLYAYSGQLQCVNNTFVNIGSGIINNMSYFYGSTSNNMNISNNIFSSLVGTTNYLIYCNMTGNNIVDYNDYYTVNGNVAYQNGAYPSLSTWQSAYPSYNKYSKNVHPYYIDSLNYTKPTNWVSLSCPRNEFVLTDIDGNLRTESTYMGCYESMFTNDASLLSFISPTPTSTASDTTKIIVKLFNYGTATLNSITCKYKINGVLYPQVDFNNLNLAKHKDTNITIGIFIPILNNSTTIEAWCENPNTTTDQNPYNDTVRIATTGCSMVLNGEYTVGNSSADFTTIANALTTLKACGISGPVVFKLYNGTYPGFTIDTTYIGSSATNTITFTSFTNNADNVIISSNTTALTLRRTHHIKFTHLTFDAQTGSKGINFTDTCSNIEIRNCKIKTNAISVANTIIGINKESTSFSIDNISIVSNIIDGGYTGIQLYGGSTLAVIGKNIRVDSNIITNTYRYGLYSRDYIQFKSVNNNTVTSRSSSAGNYFDGLHFYTYTEVNTISNNKINAIKNNVTAYANGIYCYYTNYYSATSTTTRIVNNEIIINGYYYGIYAYYTRAEISHNSIYITGVGSGSGMYIYNTLTIPVSIMNNNSVNLSSGASATAIYVLNTNTTITADYNNYYSSQGTPCRFGTPLYDLTSWQNATNLDFNSLSILPNYINFSIDLRIKGDELLCRKLSDVNHDLYGIARRQLTNMGAYHTYTPPAYDIMPLSIISPTEDISMYSSIPIRISVLNRGDSVITSFDIHWSVNGISQPVYHWSGTPLEMGDSTTPILIDYYSPSTGFNNFKFYTSLPNGNPDGLPTNDTISVVSFACSSELSGTYTIGGSSADFEDITTAVKVLKTCGVVGNIIFKIRSGIYNENISLLNPFMDASSPYTVLFTSEANHVDSVIIRSNTTAIELGDVKNLSFKYLTIDVANGLKGIEFLDGSENIEILYCKIKLNSTSTNNNLMGIYKANNTGVLNNITIKNNLIDGGYCGVYLYAGEHVSTYNLATNIVIDSNIITNTYYSGMYFYYTDINSLSYNQISSRYSNPYTNFYGIYMAYSNANIIGNKISNPSSISNSYGIYLYYYFNYFTTIPGLIANNEIITNTKNYSYGIYTNNYIRANIINNSILSRGGSNCNGIYINALISGYTINVKNNNLINESSGYPIYLNNNTSDLVMDYNNYYAPSYVGYYSGAITSITSWKSAVGKDQNSVNISPNFINTNINLELQHGIGLNCPRNTDVLIDIKKIPRKSITTIGAYEPKYELELMAVTQPLNNANLCLLELTDIKLAFRNLTLVPVNFANDSIRVHIRITGTMPYQKDTTIKIGSISGMAIDTFTVVRNYIPLDTGRYYLLAYIDNVDMNPINDTIRSSFYVNMSYQHKDTITLCDDQLPLKYGDSTFKVGTISGNYPVHFTLPTGCDSLITLTLKVNPTYKHYDILTVCDSDLPLKYGDSIFPIGTVSGIYPIHFTLSTGCDSLITLTLKVNPTYKHYDTLTVCDSDFPLKYGDSTFKVGAISGNYPIHFTLPTGCDSLITLTLKVNPTYHHYDTLTICDDQLPLKYGDSTFKVGTISGNYPIHFTLPTGCDSLITLTLKVNPTYKHYDILTVCDSDLPLKYGDSIFPIGTVSGIYPIHFTLPTGCDSLITLTLKVNPTYKHYDTLTVCDSDFPLKYGDSIFPISTISGNYPIHFTLPTGCDSLITLTLKVNPTYHHYDTLTICDDQLPLKYGDSTFKVGTISGNYTIHFTLPTGCDSLITLTLKVNPTYFFYRSLTICDNQLPLKYGDSIFPIGTITGNYFIHYTLPTGCDSLIQLALKVNPTYKHYDTLTVCDSDFPLKYGDSTFKVGTISGNYPIHFTLPTGCDSLITLTLKVNPTYHHYDTLTICDNQLPLKYGDSTFKVGTISGNYTVHFTLPTGCDSLITLTLKVNPTYKHYDTLTICSSQLPFHYGNVIFPIGTKTGTQYIYITLPTGCDSLIQLFLTVNPAYKHTDTLTICDVDLPLTYGDSIFPIGTISGNYPIHFTLPTGCDSLITLTLKVNPSYHHFDTLPICDNQLPLIYGDSIFPIGTISGNYSIHFTLPTGCDSLIDLRLTVYPTYSQYDTLTVCNGDIPYSYGDSILTVSGNYNIIFSSFNACDSIVHLKFNVFNCESTDIVDICDTDLPLVYGDSIFNASGVYLVTFKTYLGLDSVVALTLRVHSTYKHFDTLSICNSDLPFTYGDSIISAAGNYQIEFVSIYGCDSTIDLTVYILPSYNLFDTLSVCDNELPYMYADSLLINAGNYDFMLTSTEGCDSVIHVTLFIYSTYQDWDTLTICSDELPYQYGDSILAVGTTSGGYPMHFTTTTGCDSLINLTLIVNNSYLQTDTLTICNSDLPFTYGDSVFAIGTISGNYNIIYTLPTGCDSVILLTLNVFNCQGTDIVDVCLGDLPFIYGDSIFYTAGIYQVEFQSFSGQDSIITLTLRVHSDYTIYDTISICNYELPYNYNDTVFTSVGDYIVPLLSIYGCDSIINLTLLMLPSYDIYDTIVICDNQLPYSYSDSIYDNFGDYNIFLKTYQGCDSIIRLSLLSLSSYIYSDTLSICSNELPYTYGDTIFDIGTTDGDYIIHFTSISGCDSIVELNLSIYPAFSESVSVKICDSELPYQFADKEFDTGGTYEIIFTSIDGCDSVITLYLTVKNAPVAPDTIFGEIYISQVGKYIYSVENIDNTSAYIWSISNEEWIGNSTINTISVFISTAGNAYISVQAANECGSSEATEIYVQSSIGIKDLTYTTAIDLYPNPANDYFYLKINDIRGKTTVSISDITGKVLRSQEMDVDNSNQLFTFSTLYLSKGLYYVAIVNNNHTIVKKLIVE